ncbi:putative Very-long-chain 3-oxoacyl-CoA reductase [Blattamonas nauphoetae]|uniref:Very-long-chain 3-oxoacyl-CoA reductase n=1 Tax=Blattamonas nauphoetae TaxID=2049346 RepID=A0ABQ9Y3D9_9EUKA|nr:putative Very-long-chain 3-oxoacyl-CoA reductase [Blattamonas nauphoetae]
MVFATIASFIGYSVLIYLLYVIIRSLYHYLILPRIGPYANTRWASTLKPWAVVSGGGSGIGRGFAEVLAKRGFNIIILGRSRVSLMECEEAIHSHSPNVEVISAEIDFSQPSINWIPLVRSCIENRDIALLVNNVGMNTEIPGPYTEHDYRHVNAMVNCNCSATLALTKLILPLMKQNNKGGIIFLSSCTGVWACPLQAVYSATKAFIFKYAEALSEELRISQIDVLILSPFYVQSKMSGFRRTSFLVPSAVKFAEHAILFLGRTSAPQPMFSHFLLYCGFCLASLLPSRFLLWYQKGRMEDVRMKLERRRRRDNPPSDTRDLGPTLPRDSNDESRIRLDRDEDHDTYSGVDLSAFDPRTPFDSTPFSQY